MTSHPTYYIHRLKCEERKVPIHSLLKKNLINTSKMPFSSTGTFYKYLNPEAPKVIVFFHGLGSSLNYYFLIASALSSNYGCLLLDNPGAGRTKLSQDSVSAKEIGSTGLLLIEELGIANKEFLLVGHSMAGLVVNYLAGGHADGINISGCVLISPLHPLAETKPAFEKRIEMIRSSNSMEAVAEAVSTNAPGSKCSRFKKAFIQELVSAQSPEGYVANCGAILNACSHEDEFKKLYKQVGVPVLFILGDEDKTTPFEGCVELIANGVKDKTIVTLKGIGHWAALEDDETVLEEIKKFLKKISF